MPHCRICLILRGIFSVAVLIIPPGCMRSPTPETNVSASNDGKTVNLQLYSFTGVASSDYSQMVDEHHGYLSEFGAFVQAQCGISPNLFRVPPPKVITVDVGSTRFSDPHSNGPRDKLDSKYREFPFKFFQQELFVLLEKNRKVFDREKNLEISVLMVESLEGNC